MYPRPGTINFLQTSCCFTLSNCDHWLRLKQSSRNRGTGETVTKKGLNWTNLHFFYPEGTGKSSIYCRVLHGLQNTFSQWINQFHAIFTGALFVRKHTLLILFHKEIGTQIEWLDKAIHCKWQCWATLKAASKLSFTHVFTFFIHLFKTHNVRLHVAAQKVDHSQQLLWRCVSQFVWKYVNIQHPIPEKILTQQRDSSSELFSPLYVVPWVQKGVCALFHLYEQLPILMCILTHLLCFIWFSHALFPYPVDTLIWACLIKTVLVVSLFNINWGDLSFK